MSNQQQPNSFNSLGMGNEAPQQLNAAPPQAPQQQMQFQVPQQQMQFQVPQQQMQFQVPQQQMQYQAPQQQMNIGGYGGFGGASSVLPLRLPTKGYDKKKAVCAVILTVNEGGQSYDHLFRSVEQVPPEDDVAISLWEVGFKHLQFLEKKLKKESCTAERETEEAIDEIVSDIERAEPQSVLLNFECCAGCGDGQLPDKNADGFMRIIRLFLDRGHNVNTGDFSTKALITLWKSPILGPNPFLRCGECSNALQLNFSKKTLHHCPSSQLQQVAELSEKGEARLGAMGGTCLFSVDHAKSDTTEYTLEVLTVVSKVDGGRAVSDHNCEVDADGIGLVKGCAGHVLLTYPGGGNLVVSAGHWIELSKLDTDVEIVANTMASKYGAAAAAEFRSNYAGFSGAQQQQYLQTNAAQCVQSSAPVSYGNCAKKC